MQGASVSSTLRTVSVEYIITASQRPHSLLNDYAKWKDWAGFPPVSLEREGTAHVSGVGAIRRFSVLPPVREEIVEFEPPHTMSYQLLSGAPIRNHRGTVTFTAEGAHCKAHWQAQYEPIIPGTGAILDTAVRWFFRRTLGRLDRHLQK